MGYVAQDPFASFDPLRNVGANVAEAWRAHGQRPPDDLAERLVALGVADAGARLRQRPHQWSGGMLQRASIVAATAHEPPLVVADEPTSALDAAHADGVMKLLRRSSRSLLLISHDLGLVAAHADHVVVMDAGQVVESAPTDELLATPRHPLTRALLAASPRLATRDHPVVFDRFGRPAPDVDHPVDAVADDPVVFDHFGRPAPDVDHPVGDDRSGALVPGGDRGGDVPVVEVRDVTRRYRRGRTTIAAVSGVSLRLHPGHIVGITGPSGCGKSTLLRMLAGIERPDEGEVRYDAAPAWPDRRAPEPTYPRRGYVMPVFQDPFASLDHRWPIWRSVAEPLGRSGRVSARRAGPVGPCRASTAQLLRGGTLPGAASRRANVTEWLCRVGLDGVPPDARPHELSGGQCQRVALARALAARPALLVADEPTARQDALTSASLAGVLRETADDGTAVVIASHDEAWLRTLCHRIVSLDG